MSLGYSDFSGESVLPLAQDAVKALKPKLICPIHHRKRCSILLDYDENGVNAYISGCCCKEFAQVIAQALTEIEFIDTISIEQE